MLKVDVNKHLSIDLQRENFMAETCKISSFPTTDSKCEPLEVDLNKQSSSHNINLKGDNFMDKTEKISLLFPTIGVKHEPLEVDLNEQLSFSDVSLEADNCTDKARSLLLPVADVKHEPLEVDLNEQLSFSDVTLEGDNCTDKARSLLLPVADVKHEPLEVDLNEQLSFSDVTLEGDNCTDKARSLLLPVADVKHEPLQVDLNEKLSFCDVTLEGDNCTGKAGTLLLPVADVKHEPLEVDLNEQLSFSDVTLEGDNCTDKARSLLLPVADVKHEPLQVDLNEKLSFCNVTLEGDNCTGKAGTLLLPVADVKHEPIEVDLNEQLSFSDVSLKGDNCTGKAKSLLLPVANVKLEPLADNINEQFSSDCSVLNENNSTVRSLFSSFPIVLVHRRKTNIASDSELSQKQGKRLKDTEEGIFSSPNMLDCKKIMSVNPNLAEHSCTMLSKTEKSRFPLRKVLYYRRKENVSDSKLSQSTAIHAYGTFKTRLCLPEVLNVITFTKESDAELAKKKEQINVSGTVYILDHIDTTEKEINIRKVHSNEDQSLSMNNKTNEYDKDKHFPDGELYYEENKERDKCFVANGELSSEIQLLHDKNRKLNDENNKFDKAEKKINDFNDKESQKLITRKNEEKTGTREEKVQDKAPILNHHGHSYTFHKDGIIKVCCNEYQTWTMFKHDHTYFKSEKNAKIISRKKELDGSIYVQSIIRAHRKKLEERTNILEKQRKEEMLKIMEEKRILTPIDSLCSICGKMMRASCIKRHVSTFHPEDSFLCTFCGMLFQNRQEVSRHEKIYHSVVPECDICHKTFTSIYSMRVHRSLIHINRWKHTFLCSICGKKYPSSYGLKKHKWIHSDEKPFKCSYCDAKFKIKSNLSKHIRKHHTAEKASGCDIR